MNKKQKPKTSPIWKISTEEFLDVINTKDSIQEILSFFGLRHAGGNYKTLRERVKYEGVDESVLLNKAMSNRINKLNKVNKAIPIEFYLVENSNANRNHLKSRLIKEGLLEEICSKCGIGNRWNEEYLSLHLDHINGIYNDNRIENLRLLCPNCHSQTETFAGRSLKGKGLPKNKCIDCNKDIQRNSLRCHMCQGVNQSKVKNRPSNNELEELIKANGYEAVGRMYGVSGRSVKKWLEKDKLNKEKNHG